MLCLSLGTAAGPGEAASLVGALGLAILARLPRASPGPLASCLWSWGLVLNMLPSMLGYTCVLVCGVGIVEVRTREVTVSALCGGGGRRQIPEGLGAVTNPGRPALSGGIPQATGSCRRKRARAILSQPPLLCAERATTTPWQTETMFSLLVLLAKHNMIFTS